jgi:hypothetical protein
MRWISSMSAPILQGQRKGSSRAPYRSLSFSRSYLEKRGLFSQQPLRKRKGKVEIQSTMQVTVSLGSLWVIPKRELRKRRLFFRSHLVAMQQFWNIPEPGKPAIRATRKVATYVSKGSLRWYGAGIWHYAEDEESRPCGLTSWFVVSILLPSRYNSEENHVRKVPIIKKRIYLGKSEGYWSETSSVI